MVQEFAAVHHCHERVQLYHLQQRHAILATARALFLRAHSTNCTIYGGRKRARSWAM